MAEIEKLTVADSCDCVEQLEYQTLLMGMQYAVIILEIGLAVSYKGKYTPTL